MTVKYLASKKEKVNLLLGNWDMSRRTPTVAKCSLSSFTIWYLVFMGRMQGTASSVLAYSLTLYSRMTGDMDETEQNL
jgi:hypothetical protein